MGTTTTAFAEALAIKPKVGAQCSVTTLLEGLDTDTRAEVEAALDDPTIGHMRIVTALKAIGHEIGVSSIGRHRNGQCKCER